jgi:plasmid stabilization system protein ParE
MSLLSLELHAEAVAGARAARQWYESRSEDAARAFLAELDVGMESIRIAPELYPPYLHGTRCYLLRRFPYLVVYRVAGTTIQVVAVAHSRRRPGYWRARSPR